MGQFEDDVKSFAYSLMKYFKVPEGRQESLYQEIMNKKYGYDLSHIKIALKNGDWKDANARRKSERQG